MISYFGNVHLCLTHQHRGGCQWRQEKGPVGLIWPLLQMSSLSEVYSCHLVHIIQKHLQTVPDFRGQATKSLASSDPVCSRVVNRRPVLYCCHRQQGCSERQSSPPRCPLSSGTGIWEIWALSQAMGSSYKQLPVCAVQSQTLGSSTETISWKAMRTCYFPGAAKTAVQHHVCSDQMAITQFQSRGHGHKCQGSFLATDNAVNNNTHPAHESSTESTVPGLTFRVLTLTWGL